MSTQTSRFVSLLLASAVLAPALHAASVELFNETFTDGTTTGWSTTRGAISIINSNALGGTP